MCVCKPNYTEFTWKEKNKNIAFSLKNKFRELDLWGEVPDMRCYLFTYLFVPFFHVMRGAAIFNKCARCFKGGRTASYCLAAVYCILAAATPSTRCTAQLLHISTTQSKQWLTGLSAVNMGYVPIIAHL